MLLKKEMERRELLDYLYQFEERYGDALDNTELRYIFKNCELGNYVNMVPYILAQFYSEFDLVEENKNIYISLLKKIKKSFDIKNRSIVEIGGGPTPQLGKLLASEAKNVTVMDTNISLRNNKIDNLYLEQYYFLPFTDISKYDLVISYMACGTSESIICNCTNNNKDFFIGLCPCGVDSMNEVMNSNISENEYLNKIIKLAKKKVQENNMGILKIDNIKEQPEYDLPIIYNKRIKVMKYKKDV